MNYFKCRNELDDVRTGGLTLLQDKSQGIPVYWSDGIRHKGSVNLIQALVWNVGTCRPDVKGEIQVEKPKNESTDAGHRGGAASSREEGSVMELDRRGCVVW